MVTTSGCYRENAKKLFKGYVWFGKVIKENGFYIWLYKEKYQRK